MSTTLATRNRYGRGDAVAAIPDDEGRALMDDLDMLATAACRAGTRATACSGVCSRPNAVPMGSSVAAACGSGAEGR